ncbi:12353_t:CDS:2, partial [Rhizophagus irregularis]
MQQKLKQKKIDEDALKFRSTGVALPVNENEDPNASDDLNVSDDESSSEFIETDANVQTEKLEINVTNISNLPHPARDQNSKWKLQDIFIESLGEPNYLSAFIL